MLQIQKEVYSRVQELKREKTFCKQSDLSLTRLAELFFKQDFTVLYLFSSFYASRQRNWNNKTFLSAFITWFCVMIPRGNFCSLCLQVHWYCFSLAYCSRSFMSSVLLCDKWLSSLLCPREKSKGQLWKSWVYQGKGHKSCQSQRRKRRKTNHVGADTHVVLHLVHLPDHLAGEEWPAQVEEQWHSEMTLVL